MSNKIEPTIFVREYAASIKQVFDAWTQTRHLCQWQVPFQGFTCEFTRDELKAGGSTLHKMTAPNGFEMWLLTTYEEIREPELIVFRQYISNEAGEKLPNPQMPDWPREMRSTVKLSETEEGTRLEMIWEPVDPTEAEATCFDQSREGHQQGWGSGLDQLGLYLGNS